METNRMLYQIKMLEKSIIRNFCDENLKNLPSPTLPQMQIIEYALKQKDVVHQKDLETVLNLRRATVSGILQTMEKNGLLKRFVDSSDARVKTIILDKKTKEIFSMHKKKIDEVESVIVKNISKEELDTFVKVLGLMQDNIQNYAKEKKKGE